MKKTAFLLVLALLLQILLPPSVAGNVMAASAEETVQTKAAGGDDMKSLYDTYYLGAYMKAGDYPNFNEGYELKLYLRTDDDFLAVRGFDKFKATIDGEDYAINGLNKDYTLGSSDGDYSYYEISVPVSGDLEGTKEVSLIYPDRLGGSKTIGGVTVTLKKEDYFTTKGSKEVEIENPQNPIYTSSKTGNSTVASYWVSAFRQKEDQEITKAYLVNEDGKDGKQYDLNREIMQVSVVGNSGIIQDNRYPAKKMPFADGAGDDIPNRQYTYGIEAGFRFGMLVHETLPNGVYSMVLETENGYRTIIKKAVISTDQPVVCGVMDSQTGSGNIITPQKLYGEDDEIFTDKGNHYVAVYVYGLNLNDEVANYVKPFFVDRSYDESTGEVTSTIAGSYTPEDGYEVGNNGIFYRVHENEGADYSYCGVDTSEYKQKYGENSVALADPQLETGKFIRIDRPVIFARQLGNENQTNKTVNRLYLRSDVADVGDTVKLKIEDRYEDYLNPKTIEISCVVQENKYSKENLKYIEIRKEDMKESHDTFYYISELTAGNQTYDDVSGELNFVESYDSSSGEIFDADLPEFTKDGDVYLEIRHPNELQTILKKKLSKGTDHYILTEEDMKLLEEAQEYVISFRRVSDKVLLKRRTQRVAEGFIAPRISLSEEYPATKNTVCEITQESGTAKLYYYILSNEEFENLYDYNANMIPEDKWIPYSGKFTPFTNVKTSGTFVVAVKAVNEKGTLTECRGYGVDVEVGSGDNSGKDDSKDDTDKGNNSGTNGGNQGNNNGTNNGNQNGNGGSQNAAGTLAVGTVKEVKGQNYKILSASTVAFVGVINGKTKKVNIPKTVQINKKTYKVVQIAKNALKGSDVQTVVIGANVTAIQDQAFAGCKKLKKVTVGANVKNIGKAAFKDCKNLKNITVKSTKLKTVKANALKGINKKATIKVPAKKLKNYQKLFRKKGQSSSVKIKK